MDSYQYYKMEEWLEDTGFLRWVKQGMPEDNKVLTDLLKGDSEASQTMQAAVQLLHTIGHGDKVLSEGEVEILWENIRSATQPALRRSRLYALRRSRLYTLRRIAAVAASVLVIAGTIAYLVLERQTALSLQSFALNLPVDSCSAVCLQLADQSVLEFPDRTEFSISHDNILNILTLAGDKSTILLAGKGRDGLCQLIVPVGKRALLQLADGTNVTLHPSSKVVFPTVFARRERTVFLQGEAFLEVTKNKKRPFVVETAWMNVNVLGTSFNVSAKLHETIHSVVLVSGVVDVKAKGQPEVRLLPDERYQLNRKSQQHCIDRVNPHYFTSWKDGVLLFESTQLEEVLNRLRSYYGVRFEYPANDLSSIRISGTLDLNGSIEKAMKVLETICRITTEYKGNTLVLNVQP